MKSRSSIIVCLFVLGVISGCSSAKVTERQQLVKEALPRPPRILVYNFASTPGEVPTDASIAGQYDAPSTPPTAEQIATGHRLGAEIAAQLVQEIQGMGMPAYRASRQAPLQLNDILIRGYLVSIEEGSEAKRLVIGFGSGASELRTMVEGYQVTEQGLRKLGSGTVESGGSKGPGALLGVAGLAATGNPAGLIISTGIKVYGEASGKSTVEGRAQQTAKEIADVLKQRFQQEGWIQ